MIEINAPPLTYDYSLKLNHNGIDKHIAQNQRLRALESANQSVATDFTSIDGDSSMAGEKIETPMHWAGCLLT